MRDLPPIQALWVGQTLSVMERLSIASFLRAGHAYHLYAYNSVGNVPHGTVLMDAAEIIPARSMFRDTRGTFAAFSDLFRYKLLCERGGWWADTDLVCVRPFEFDRDVILATEPDNTVGSAVMCVPPGHPLVATAWRRCSDVDDATPEWGVMGPRLLIELVRELQLETFLTPSPVFFPIDWHEWDSVIDPHRVWRFDPMTRSIHLWNSMWDLAGVDKNERRPESCLYEVLKREYLGGS